MYVGWSKLYSYFGRLTLLNRIDKKFYRPVEIARWIVVVYADQSRFAPPIAQEMVGGLVNGCRKVGENQRDRSLTHPNLAYLQGMRIADDRPIIKWENGQGNIGQVGVETQDVYS